MIYGVVVVVDDGDDAHVVVVCRRVKPSGLEVRLRKKESVQWNKLEGPDPLAELKRAEHVSPATAVGSPGPAQKEHIPSTPPLASTVVADVPGFAQCASNASEDVNDLSGSTETSESLAATTTATTTAATTTAATTATAAQKPKIPYPSARVQDWDRVAKELDLGDEKPEGEQALQVSCPPALPT